MPRAPASRIKSTPASFTSTAHAGVVPDFHQPLEFELF
jgi:hypothetical protein